MTTNYDGLTKNSWPGTWSPSSNAPIALDTELRGTLQSISGETGDRLTDIYGQRLTEGMMVYLKTGYSAGGKIRSGDTYYKYKLLNGESRNASTGSMPNSDSNWTEVSFGSSSNQVVSGNLDLSEDFVITSTTDSTDLLTGALQVRGGAAVGGNLFVGGDVFVNGNVKLAQQTITLAELPPDDPKQGDIWYDLLEGGSYQYISDDTSSFWIQFGSSF
jgi:hypothetical protein